MNTSMPTLLNKATPVTCIFCFQTVTDWLDPHGYFASLPAVSDPTTQQKSVAPTRKARMHFNDISPYVAAAVGSAQSYGARCIMYPTHKCAEQNMNCHGRSAGLDQSLKWVMPCLQSKRGQGCGEE